MSVLICDKVAEQILLVKERKLDSKTEPNWEILGGFVDLLSSTSHTGESLEAALEREIKEELGHENARILMRHLSYLKSFGETYRDGTPMVVVYFLAAIEKRDLTLQSSSGVLMKWFEMSDLPCFEYVSDREAIECAKKEF